MASAILIAALGASLFSSFWIGLVCAALLASMPLVYSAAVSNAVVYQWLIVIAWLLGIDRYRVSLNVIWLAAAGAALGLGLYGRASAMVMMPIDLLLTLVALVITAPNRRPSVPTLAAPLVAFVAVAVPFGIFLLRHPEYFRDAVLAHGLYDARRYNVFQGAREVFSWVGLTVRVEVYWDYFNPAFLFPLLLPSAVLLPIGVWRVIQHEVSITWWLIVGGLLIAPAVGALVAQPPSPAHLLPAAPFAALLATGGLMHLVNAWRWPPYRSRRSTVADGSPASPRMVADTE